MRHTVKQTEYTRYKNPIVRGFCPDPSVCADGRTGRYYMVCSTFQYFPAVALFESDDLVNWERIGYVLTRSSQVALEGVESSGGVFAPTIRYHDGRFYMVTTNNSTRKNFYVYTDDIYGEWSEPVEVAQDGIDPSVFFDGGRVYFLSTGTDDRGVSGIIQCEIDISTGRKLTESRCIWKGSGGRFPEGPHMYKLEGRYYLMIAEGGTEYGHMITCARADSPWGEFESCPYNPILTNRNSAPDIIQGIGHGDLIADKYGALHIICLGFRQLHEWNAYHTLGREVFMVPASITPDGWISAGTDGVCRSEYDITGGCVQHFRREYALEDFKRFGRYLRIPNDKAYCFGENSVKLYGSEITLSDAGSPTFVGHNQQEFDFEFTAEVSLTAGGSGASEASEAAASQAGITAYMSEAEHYDVAVRAAGAEVSEGKANGGFEAICSISIGGISKVIGCAPLKSRGTMLRIAGSNSCYRFYALTSEGEVCLGSAMAKYLSSEVSGGFTGTVLAMYVQGENSTGEFSAPRIIYTGRQQ